MQIFLRQLHYPSTYSMLHRRKVVASVPELNDVLVVFKEQHVIVVQLEYIEYALHKPTRVIYNRNSCLPKSLRERGHLSDLDLTTRDCVRVNVGRDRFFSDPVLKHKRVVLSANSLQILCVGEYVEVGHRVPAEFAPILAVDGTHFKRVIAINESVLVLEYCWMSDVHLCLLCYFEGALQVVLDHEGQIEGVGQRVVDVGGIADVDVLNILVLPSFEHFVFQQSIQNSP